MYYPLPMLAPKLFRNTVVCKTAGVHLKAEMKGEVPIRLVVERGVRIIGTD